MKPCLIIGSTVCDVIINLPEIPASAQDANIYGQTLQIGGCAFNVVSILHQLSMPYTFLSPIGTGVYGKFVETELQKAGIITTIRTAQENGCCYCLVEASGERTFLSYHGAEYTFQKEWTDSLDLSSYEYIYACGIEIEDKDGPRIVDCLASCDGQVVFAPGPRYAHISQEIMNRIYALKPILHVNEIELRGLSGKTDINEGLQELYKRTGNIVIVTLGKNGSTSYDGSNFVHAPSKKVTVADTIGAGDSHVGAVIAGLCMHADMKDILGFANDIAGAVVSKKGAGLEPATALEIYYQYFKKRP